MLFKWKSKFNRVIKELKMYIRIINNDFDVEDILDFDVEDILDFDVEDILDFNDHDWFNNKCLSCIECNGPCIRLNNY